MVYTEWGLEPKSLQQNSNNPASISRFHSLSTHVSWKLHLFLNCFRWNIQHCPSFRPNLNGAVLHCSASSNGKLLYVEELTLLAPWLPLHQGANHSVPNWHTRTQGSLLLSTRLHNSIKFDSCKQGQTSSSTSPINLARFQHIIRKQSWLPICQTCSISFKIITSP